MKPLSVLLFLICIGFSNAQSKGDLKRLDSIYKLRSISKSSDQYSIDERQQYAELAVKLSEELNIDSTLLNSSKNLASFYYNTDQYENYRNTNRINLKLASQIKDSSSVGIALINLGYYYYLESNSDSSYFYYYQAREIFKRLGDKQNEAEALAIMADIQETERDYIGSESNAVKAIKLIEQLPKTDRNLDTIWILYNLLGINSRKLEMYDKAIEYHSQALSYSNQIKGTDGFVNRLFSLNNLAIVYRNLKDYETALSYHDQIVNDPNIERIDKESLAFYMSNYQFTKFLSGDYMETELLSALWNSRDICDLERFEFCSLTIRMDLANYYKATNKSDSALVYARQANKIARETSQNDQFLESLFLMSQLEEGETGKSHLNRYVSFSDSLLHNERVYREKFARLEYETDQILAENVQISRERLIFLLSSIALLVMLILLYIVISQRSRNRKLRFQQEQQQANEEIYNLMLAQQDKMDEGRSKEKKRISEELHDGILGRLFGTRLSLDSLNLQNTDDAVKTRGQYIQELKSIEQEIRKISHDLNTDFIAGSSFSDILNTLIENQTQAFQLTYDYHEDDEIDWDALSNKTKIHIYRMLQETMQNVYKHAKASHIKISFELKNDVILLSVEDNGSGFNTSKARKGIGLKNFDSRASEIGGKVEIFSKEGLGTKVKIFAPTT
ncbi:MAG: tetratricopeptide repeat protein [Bacteroidia bacterium]|nr:tetratricopeptide repeat protein [Bacteroidia bacterium]NNF81833.1 tetratricopeptide repeat protein [Flavobacteriaceae bacterium]